jgi:DNA polymerase I-like protein with 3'-5' exonuclease and polymerase domains
MPKPEPKVDWAAFEMRIAVAVQDGTIFIDTETTGPDFYSEYGSKRFGVPPENITPAMRRMVKNDVFCRLYGGSGVFTP